MTEEPLWSERKGGNLRLTKDGFAKLVERLITSSKNQRLFEQVLGLTNTGIPRGQLKAHHHPAEFFTFRLGDPWAAGVLETPALVQFEGDDRIFDLLELLFKQVVSYPTDPGVWPSEDYDQSEGQERFRAATNRVLQRRDPPLEMLANGNIVERVGEPFRRLVEQPLPEHAPKKEVTERVDDAVSHFRRRDARAGDRRAAVRELADALEFIRKDVKTHLLTEDERLLFRLANEFAIRHNKRETRRDFDEPAWLAWAFYVYLATIRLTLELVKRQEDIT
jgi:hypothetical protein